MGFWDNFQYVIASTWRFLNTDMTIGGTTFSFADVLVVGGVCTIAGWVVWEVINESD